MKTNTVSRMFITCHLLLMAIFCTGQQSQPQNDLIERARLEFSAGNFSAAERDFRKLTKTDPSNITAYMFLGESLFRQQKFHDAAKAYEKARELDASQKFFSLEQRRILTDQLAMSYGMGGQLGKARALLEEAIPQDPEYPLNYYNLACAFAEMGNKDKMLVNLELALQRKDNMIKGEQFPDPRTDSSFQRYVADKQFLTLMNEYGYTQSSTPH